MTKFFNRFEKQCRSCVFYIGNTCDKESYDPDEDCKLNHDVFEGTGCDDHEEYDE
jgi:hypothetical protein